MSDDFIERDGLTLAQYVKHPDDFCTLVHLTLNAVRDGSLEGYEELGSWPVDLPEQIGAHQRDRKLIEALVRYVDSGAQPFELSRLVRRFEEAWAQMCWQEFSPDAPWYLWCTGEDDEGAIQNVWRNDETAQVWVITKGRWNAIYDLDEFHERQHSRGDYNPTIGPSFPVAP